MIILEGMDASGKTTLGEELIHHLNDIGNLGYGLIHSGGPEKYPGEIAERTRTLPRKGRFVLDRHPVISQHVYARDDKDPPPTMFTKDQVVSYLKGMPQRPVIVFCCGRAPHKAKPGEDAEHIAFVEKKWEALKTKYDELFVYFARQSVPYITYDFTNPPMIRSAVVHRILKREDEATHGA